MWDFDSVWIVLTLTKCNIQPAWLLVCIRKIIQVMNNVEGKVKFLYTFSMIFCIEIFITFDAAYPTTFLQLLPNFHVSIFIFLWFMAVARRHSNIYLQMMTQYSRKNLYEYRGLLNLQEFNSFRVRCHTQRCNYWCYEWYFKFSDLIFLYYH